MAGRAWGGIAMVTPRAYVLEQLALITGGPVSLTDDQVACFWDAFTRQEEREAEKDAYGNFAPESSYLSRQGVLETPPLHKEIAALQPATPVLSARWPRGHRFAACLTHDVDRIVQLPWRERARQIARFHRQTSARQMARWLAATSVYAAADLCGRSDRATFDFWMQEEAKHGFHSTFFVLPEDPIAPTFYDHYYRYTDPIRYEGRSMAFAEGARLAQAVGWEIGLHGSFASAFQQEIFAAEKRGLETMLDAPVATTRQHFLRFAIETTPAVQARSGIEADSTLGYSATIGCRAGLAFPFFFAEHDVLEVPLVIQDVGLLRTHGEAPDLTAAIARAQALIRKVAAAGGVVTLSWHTHPESPGACACYQALLATVAALGGWGCSLGELNTWWRARRALYREQIHGAGSGEQATCHQALAQ